MRPFPRDEMQALKWPVSLIEWAQQVGDHALADQEEDALAVQKVEISTQYVTGTVGSEQEILEAPTGQETVLSELTFCVPTAVSPTITVHIVPSGETLGASHIAYIDSMTGPEVVAAGAVNGRALNEGTKVYVSASAARS